MKELMQILTKREDFYCILKKKSQLLISIDSPEKYFINEKGDYLTELPKGQDWTTKGLSSADITVKYFPNLFSLQGLSLFLSEIKIWVRESIKEPTLWKIHPFQKFEHWMFTLDSWQSHACYMVDRKNLSQEEVNEKVLNLKAVEENLKTSSYIKITNTSFYSLRNDPTCIVSLEDHDLRDGYSYKKINQLLNEWMSVISNNKNNKFYLNK